MTDILRVVIKFGSQFQALNAPNRRFPLIHSKLEVIHRRNEIFGNGEMADLTRDLDWASTSIGSVEQWPDLLLTTVNTILGSRHPMFLWWGEELIQFYNDAYRPSIGEDKHPSALGQRGPECWPEIWSIIGPEIEAVMVHGEASWHNDQLVPIQRNGKLEDVYWTYGYSPIRDTSGKICGTLVVCTDTTDVVLAKRQLKFESDRLGDLFQQAPAFFAVLRGPNHIFEMTNAPYQQLVGRDVLGKSVVEGIPEAVDQGFIRLLDRAYQGGEPFVGRSTPIRLSRTGTENFELRYLDFVYQPLRDTEGLINGILVLGTDVTDQRRAQDGLRELAAIVDSSDDVILSKDLNGTITSWNPAAARLFGYSAEEMVGSSILKLIPEDLHSDEKTIIDQIRAGQRVEHFDTIRLTKDGRRIEVSLTVSPIRDDQGRVIGASKILRDISDRKRIEQSLLQAEKIAATGRMAATIAHEINNPLEAVTNLLFLLRSKIIDKEGQDFLATAEGELGRVAHITKQTLGYYREHATASLASLSEIAQYAITIYGPRCNVAKIEIQTSLLSKRKTVVRRGEMMQVISNLIANSIQAMPHGGRLSVSVEDAEKPTSGITLTVSDNGEGIAAHDLPRVFEAFFTTRSTIGTGIGLFVVKQFIEGHGGEISIASQRDAEVHGTTIRLFLPLHTRYDTHEDA